MKYVSTREMKKWVNRFINLYWREIQVYRPPSCIKLFMDPFYFKFLHILSKCSVACYFFLHNGILIYFFCLEHHLKFMNVTVWVDRVDFRLV